MLREAHRLLRSEVLLCLRELSMKAGPLSRTATVALCLASSLLTSACGGSVDGARIAVASNFQQTMLALESEFEATSEHAVTLSFGSTGKQYAQIVNGAPFAAFLAADVERPKRLEDRGLAVDGTRFTYALGRLVLWSPRPGYVDPTGALLGRGEFRHLAIANPALAPYGMAARQSLEALGLWQRLNGRIVRGENVTQSHQYVVSGNAELGFVAYSQVLDDQGRVTGSIWEVPRDLYSPIEQQAVLLEENAAARALLAFVDSEAGRAIIRRHGYDTP